MIRSIKFSIFISLALFLMVPGFFVTYNIGFDQTVNWSKCLISPAYASKDKSPCGGEPNMDNFDVIRECLQCNVDKNEWEVKNVRNPLCDKKCLDNCTKWSECKKLTKVSEATNCENRRGECPTIRTRKCSVNKKSSKQEQSIDCEEELYCKLGNMRRTKPAPSPCLNTPKGIRCS